jgi:deoxycytidylate deaminase
VNNRIEVFKNFTVELSSLSKCEERKVAAIITDYKMTQIYSIGVNGGARGLDNCMCKIDGKFGCSHAEINALIKNMTQEPNKIMFVTLAPCKQCAAAIINTPGGFSTLYYFEDWKEDTGIKLLSAAGVRVVKI